MSTRQSSATSSEGEYLESSVCASRDSKSQKGVLEIGLPTNSEGGVAPGAKINVVETAPPINAVVGTYRAGLARTIRWVHRTVFLFNIPVWIGSDISELPVSASDRYLEDRWKVVRRSFSTLSRNSNICAAVISG